MKAKGFQVGHKYIPLTEEGRQRIIAAHKGKPRPDWVRKKISLAHKGKKLSIETKEKLSLVQKGRKQSPELIAKRVAGRKGYTHSEETKQRIKFGLRNAFNGHIYKTDESKLWRKREEFKRWREAVFQRDDWTCQRCKIKGGSLHPHHIRNFTECPDKRFDPDNGITFCADDHKQFHKRYGQRNNTPEQILDYIKSRCLA